MRPSIPVEGEMLISSPAIGPSASAKGRPTLCQEVEVKGRDTGTLGGVGRHCPAPATQFCSTCSKMVCQAHYERIHSIHDIFGSNASLSMD